MIHCKILVLRFFAVLLAGLALAGPIAAQTYPSRTIKVINSWPPGGPGDMLTRPIMAKLSERLGQPVIIENRPGGNAMIGTAAVARAAPDGYTLLTATLSPIAISPAQEAKMPYDPVKDFEPITQLVSAPVVLLMRSGLPVDSLQSLIAYGKANPGKLSYGTLGNLSSTHLAGEMLLSRAGFTMLPVPYKGGAQVMTDLIGGQIDVGFIGIGGAMPFIESGKLRALAVTTTKRSSLLPAVPTINEFFPGYEMNSWYGMMAPAGTPKDIVARLHREFVAILQMPEIVQLLKANGLDAEGTTPEEFSAKVKEEVHRWGEIVKTVVPAK